MHFAISVVGRPIVIQIPDAQAQQYYQLLFMNFLNFITTAETLLNFKLSNHLSAPRLPVLEKHEASAFRKVSEGSNNTSEQPIDCEDSKAIDTIMQERQRLINQYLQLNIQILEKQIKDKDKADETLHQQVIPPAVQEQCQSNVQTHKKKIKKTNNCGHQDKAHYAKGMCANCYHRFGRIKKPWKCPHQKLYAAGMCQNCYINEYNRKRREEATKNYDNKTERMQNLSSQVVSLNQLPIDKIDVKEVDQE